MRPLRGARPRMNSSATTSSVASEAASAKDEPKAALSRSASASSKSAFGSALDGEDDFSPPGETGTTREKVRHGGECLAGPFSALVRGWNVLFCCQEPNRKSSR
jgi:uncharacterized membrane protein